MLIVIGILSVSTFLIAYFYITWKSIIIDENLPKRGIYKTFDHQKQKTLYLESQPKTNKLKLVIISFHSMNLIFVIYMMKSII